MGNLGLPEVVAILILALVVIGPRRLPTVARDTARFVARVREEASRSLDELRRAADLDDLDDLRRVRDEVVGAADDVRGAMRGQRPMKPRSAGGPSEVAPSGADDGDGERPATPVDLEAT